MTGLEVGALVTGIAEGSAVTGAKDGGIIGLDVVGAIVTGNFVGLGVTGFLVGLRVGFFEGSGVVGVSVGMYVVGTSVGSGVTTGCFVGFVEGLADGYGVNTSSSSANTKINSGSTSPPLNSLLAKSTLPTVCTVECNLKVIALKLPTRFDARDFLKALVTSTSCTTGGPSISNAVS